VDVFRVDLTGDSCPDFASNSATIITRLNSSLAFIAVFSEELAISSTAISGI
jgi:hypothetical protein